MELDVRGMVCPRPLIEAKKALKGMNTGEKLSILLDNPTSQDNVVRYLKELGLAPQVAEHGPREVIINVTKTNEISQGVQPEDYCAPLVPDKSADTVVVISSDTMGRGADELGKLLLQAFINVLPEAEQLPRQIIFYNAGVTLAVEGSPVLASLKALSSNGVLIQACGTCLDYYRIKDKLAVGEVTNMYSIVESLGKAAKIITP